MYICIYGNVYLFIYLFIYISVYVYLFAISIYIYYTDNLLLTHSPCPRSHFKACRSSTY